MRIEASNILNLYFKDNYFMGDVWSKNGYSTSLPAISFPQGEEEKIKNKFINLFGIDEFNDNYNLDALTFLIENGQTIWGFINDNGHILSLYSMFDLNNSINDIIYSYLDKLELEYPNISNYASKEDRFNAIIAFYLLENNENPMVEVCQKYYQNLLLKDELSKNLDNNNPITFRTKV